MAVVQFSTVQYTTVQYSSVQYSTVQYSTVQSSTVQYSTVQYSAVQCSAVQCSAVHTIKQNAQNRTYITIRIHKHNNKNTQFTKLNRSTQNTQPYIQLLKKWNQKNMKECDKRKSHISSKLHMIYISSDNVRHSVTKTLTTLHPTTLHVTTLVDTSLHYTCRHFTSI